jgi:nucleotide-binding universal stress UspA family protein
VAARTLCAHAQTSGVSLRISGLIWAFGVACALRACPAQAEMKILLAIDGSECSAVATHAVVVQCRPQGAHVRVIHAINWEHIVPISLQFERGSEVAHAYQQLRDVTARGAEALVARAARQLRDAGFPTSTTVREGEPRRVILDGAAEWRAELIVVGSHGKTGLDRVLLGSVSEHVARHARCSVEIVRMDEERPRSGASS